MRIGIYDPYLDTLGGGEKYVLDIAACLKDEHDVTFFWDGKDVKHEILIRFSIDPSFIHFVPNIFKERNFLKKVRKTIEYDVLFFVSDGSIPFLYGKKNILIFQHPTIWVKKNLISTLKLRKIHSVIVYSDFVKRYIDATFDVKSLIIPPLVETINAKSSEKENIILSVGRYTKAMNTKKQEILIEVFKKIHEKNHDWKLVMVGSCLANDKDYVQELKNQAKGYPISIQTNINRGDLENHYKKAKIYWHAAGFGEDLMKNPERAEHFGISTVEAMGAGCVPVVINAGGQKEIVENKISGYLWSTKDEFKMSNEASSACKSYTKEAFCKSITSLISS